MSTIPPTAAGRRGSGSPKRSPGLTAMPARWPSCRATRRRRSIAGSTGCGRSSMRSPGARPRLAAELFDTGANMGPAVAATFLQRALTALNRNGKDYPDLVPDGRIGDADAGGARRFPRRPAATQRRDVLLRALEALQGERYLRLAERRPANEAFLYGWLANRMGEYERRIVASNREALYAANSEGGCQLRLPPPSTFAEGQRLVYGLLAAAAGMFCGLCAVAMIALLMWGGWSAAEEHSDRRHLRLGARRVHRRHGRGDRRPAGRRAGRPLQGQRRTATAPASKRTEASNDPELACSTCRASPESPRRLPARPAAHPEKRDPPLAQAERPVRAAVSRRAAAHAETVANYRVAAEAARRADTANAATGAAAQADINERTIHDFEARLAAARARADRLRREAEAAAADSCGRRAAPVPAATRSASAAMVPPRKDRLPAPTD